MLEGVSTRLSSTILVGRDEQLAALNSALDSAREGRPVTVLIGGEAGIGKSRLVNEFAATARGSGALVLRGGLIAAGGALIEHIGWIFYVFGALVLLAGVRMLRPGPDPGAGLIARWRARTGATPLLAALIAVETTDLVFALDSIPAVFGVTSNLFVVFTSNAFAVLGLRALYFLVAGSVRRFSFLKPAIAVLLMFIGVKMLISPFVHLPVTVTLVAIVIVAGGAVAASLWRGRSPR